MKRLLLFVLLVISLAVVALFAWQFRGGFKGGELVHVKSQHVDQPSPPAQHAEKAPCGECEPRSTGRRSVVSLWCKSARADQSFDCKAEFFGSALPFVKEMDAATDAVSFEVQFAFDGRSVPISIATAAFNEKIPFSVFKEAVSPLALELRRKQLNSSTVTKPYRRTIVFEDETGTCPEYKSARKIPRYMKKSFSFDYQQWCKLRDEAYQQMEAERIHKYRQRSLLREQEKMMKAPVSDEEAQKVLAIGKLLIRAK